MYVYRNIIVFITATSIGVVFSNGFRDSMVGILDPSLTGSLGRWKSKRLQRKRNKWWVYGGPDLYYQRFTVWYFVHHRSQGSKVRVAHCILGWDPLFGFILKDTQRQQQKQKRCKERIYGVEWIKNKFFSLGILQKGTCSKDLVRRHPVEALCGSGTVERSGQSDRTRNLRCYEYPATSPQSVSLWNAKDT